MVFNNPQRLQTNYMNWPQMEDPLISIDESHDGYCQMDNDFNEYLEEFLRDKSYNDIGDECLKNWLLPDKETQVRDAHAQGMQIKEIRAQNMQTEGMRAQEILTQEMPLYDFHRRETNDNCCFRNPADDSLDGSLRWSSMNDASSLLRFENDYLLSDIDDGSMTTYQNMRKYRRKLELQMMMLAKMTRAQDELLTREDRMLRERQFNQYQQNVTVPNFSSSIRVEDLCPPGYRSTGGPMLMPIGEVHQTQSNTSVQRREENWPGKLGHVQSHGAPALQNQDLVDKELKNQWCSNRKNGSYQNQKTAMNTQAQVNRRPPQPPQDDPYEPLSENLLVKVRNIHPTPSLHELHVQYPEMFGQKPAFTCVQYGYSLQRKKRFAVMCQFEFNGALLFAQETAPTKSDAKLNAARAMIRKLKHTANVSVTLRQESMRAAADTSLEHPRCRLLHLHDTQPEIYPQPPIFRTFKSRNGHGAVNKSRYTNMICYFQVGTDKLKTVGAAHNKKQAIVQAARNMLQLLALPEHSVKNNLLKVEYTPPDRTQTPWTCHFCKIFMTGRRPFLSHLMGRCHVQRLSELGLNAEQENRVLRELAEKASEKKEEQKRKAALKKGNLKRDQRLKTQEMKAEREQNSKKTTSLDRSISVSSGEMGSERQSEGGYEKSDMTLGSSSNSSSQSL